MASFISDQKLADLKDHFSFAIWDGIRFCGETGDDSTDQKIDIAWECLVASYSSSTGELPVQQRKYHNLGHIAECIDALNEWETEFSDLELDYSKITLAIFYHDICYNVLSKTNERNSAAQAICALSEFDLCGSYLGDIYDMILATRHTTQFYDNEMLSLICDIDLKGLAKPYDQFRIASEAIADEFASFPKNEYISGRIKWIESMLSRPKIYRTIFFRRQCEENARKNLETHLKEMREMQVKSIKVHAEAKEQSNAV